MSHQNGKEHWFRYRDASVFVIERSPEKDLTLSPRSLFFLHGRFGQAEIWDPVIQALSFQFRCITLDLPGFGRSFLVKDRPFDLLEYSTLVDELIARFQDSPQLPRNLSSSLNTRVNPDVNAKAVLIGHEVGGAIAQLCTLKHPERIMGLVLINSAMLSQALNKVRLGFLGWLAKCKIKKLLGIADNMELACKALEDSWPQFYERQSWKNSIQNIVQPVLLLWGGEDSFFPPEMGVEMVQRLPDVNFFVHERAGHWPSLEQPEWVLSKLREFLFRIGFEATPTPASAQKALLR